VQKKNEHIIRNGSTINRGPRPAVLGSGQEKPKKEGSIVPQSASSEGGGINWEKKKRSSEKPTPFWGGKSLQRLEKKGGGQEGTNIERGGNQNPIGVLAEKELGKGPDHTKASQNKVAFTVQDCHSSGKTPQLRNLKKFASGQVVYRIRPPRSQKPAVKDR